MMKVSLENIVGAVVKDDERYKVEDNTFLKNLTLSKTTLYADQETTGHSHDDLDEVYIFLFGTGYMIVDKLKFEVSEGDVILIPGGAFHKVHNDDIQEPLVFACVFQAYERE